MEMQRPVKVCGLNGSRYCFCNMADQLREAGGSRTNVYCRYDIGNRSATLNYGPINQPDTA